MFMMLGSTELSYMGGLDAKPSRQSSLRASAYMSDSLASMSSCFSSELSDTLDLISEEEQLNIKARELKEMDAEAPKDDCLLETAPPHIALLFSLMGPVHGSNTMDPGHTAIACLHRCSHPPSTCVQTSQEASR